jgi:hypothetical protein
MHLYLHLHIQSEPITDKTGLIYIFWSAEVFGKKDIFFVVWEKSLQEKNGRHVEIFNYYICIH